MASASDTVSVLFSDAAATRVPGRVREAVALMRAESLWNFQRLSESCGGQTDDQENQCEQYRPFPLS